MLPAVAVAGDVEVIGSPLSVAAGSIWPSSRSCVKGRISEGMGSRDERREDEVALIQDDVAGNYLVEVVGRPGGLSVMRIA